MARDKEQYNEYMAAYMRKQYAANAEWVQSIKLEKGCTDCGYNAHHAGLEFDHLEGRGGDQSRTIARLMGKSRKRIQQEMDKCEVVCATCHRIRTWNRLKESQVENLVNWDDLPSRFCKCGSEIDKRGRTERCRKCR